MNKFYFSRHGLLVPNATTDQELQHLRNSLPDTVRIKRIDERLSALGNVIAWCVLHFVLDVKPSTGNHRTKIPCISFGSDSHSISTIMVHRLFIGYC